MGPRPARGGCDCRVHADNGGRGFGDREEKSSTDGRLNIQKNS